MRVLVAYDGSEGAVHAIELAKGIAWPAQSSVRVVAAVPALPVALSPGWAGGMPEAVLDARRGLARLLEAEMSSIVRDLAGAGLDADGAVLDGRPASVIVEQAQAFEADLLVVGSRGRGAIEGLLLGSVSAEVLDHAGCPVLVARQPTISRVIFAFDGSEPALRAQTVLSSWPIFKGIPIRVVSVATVVAAWHTGIAPTMHAQVVATYADDIEREREAQGEAATTVAAQLAERGRIADFAVRAGDPATEILAAARDSGSDLIVMGSHGRTGLTRILLGSVARNVAHGSSASVLIVRNS